MVYPVYRGKLYFIFILDVLVYQQYEGFLSVFSEKSILGKESRWWRCLDCWEMDLLSPNQTKVHEYYELASTGWFLISTSTFWPFFWPFFPEFSQKVVEKIPRSEAPRSGLPLGLDATLMPSSLFGQGHLGMAASWMQGLIVTVGW